MEVGCELLHLVALLELDERLVAVGGVSLLGIALLDELLPVLVGVGLLVVGGEVELVQ